MTPEKMRRRIGRRVTVLALALFLCACGGSGGGSGTGPIPVRPASGTLDNSFGGTGYVTHDGASADNSFDVGLAVAIDNAGRIVVSGASVAYPTTYMAVWRFLPDGTLDSSFGGRGFVACESPGGGGDTRGQSVAIDESGRIVVAGFASTGVWRRSMVVWRFNADGTLDNSFAGKGFVTSDNTAGGGRDIGTSLVIDGDGRIVVAGSSVRVVEYNGYDVLAIWRYNPDGTPDNSFGGTGYVTHDNAAGAGKSVIATSLALDGTGRIVVLGRSQEPIVEISVLVLWRFDRDGNIDTSFGGTGYVVQDNTTAGGGGSDLGSSLAIDRSGRLLVAGRSRNAAGDYDMTLWRFGSDGTLDNTFAGKGYVTHDNAAGGSGWDYGSSVAVDEKGRILVAGQSFCRWGNPYPSIDKMALWRFNADGSLDESLGGTGYVTQDVDSENRRGTADYRYRIAFDATGRIVVGGSKENAAGDADVALWRFFP